MSTAFMPRLFDDAPNYTSTSFPAPRAFQQAAHDALRQGFRDGHKNQLIMAPTRLSSPVENPAALAIPEVRAIGGLGLIDSPAAANLLASEKLGRVDIDAVSACKINEAAHSCLRTTMNPRLAKRPRWQLVCRTA